MGQSKIKSIQANGTFDGQNGLRYKWEVALDDGSVGEVVTISEGRWSAGDEVVYEKQETQWGVKLKLQKPGMSGGYGGGQKRASDPNLQKRIDASWSIGQAIAMLGCVNDYDAESVGQYLGNVRSLSAELLKIRNEKV